LPIGGRRADGGGDQRRKGKEAQVKKMNHSIDNLQNHLAKKVFGHTKAPKKAAGRALGTLVEVIIFYLLKSWRLGSSIAIERGLTEYQNADVAHNVEYTLHPVKCIDQLQIENCKLPLTAAKIFKVFRQKLPGLSAFTKKNQTLLSSSKIFRNACVIGEQEQLLLVGLVSILEGGGQAELAVLKQCGTIGRLELDLATQYRSPYAVFECKRVGVEKGLKKGPQTIEKAKQGAYVARTVSSLQKIRTHSGELYGVISKNDDKLYAKPYKELIQEVIASDDPELLRHFILTVGVVSNHGNWFTSGNKNKEMIILAQSYDWLLFLTDEGLADFVNDLILNENPAVSPVRTAFLSSYKQDKKKNCFTKVQMALDADKVLQDYFKANGRRIERWFNIITPDEKSLGTLRRQIRQLSEKDWPHIHNV
jgi:hypothetical protein